jgi:hypothetical protein
MLRLKRRPQRKLWRSLMTFQRSDEEIQFIRSPHEDEIGVEMLRFWPRKRDLAPQSHKRRRLLAQLRGVVRMVEPRRGMSSCPGIRSFLIRS